MPTKCGCEIRKQHGYQCPPGMESVESLPTEILEKFHTSLNQKNHRGGREYQPTDDEEKLIAECLYKQGGILQQIREARLRAPHEDFIEPVTINQTVS